MPGRGLTAWSYDLYVVLDIFSRYVVAWCVARTESGELFGFGIPARFTLVA